MASTSSSSTAEYWSINMGASSAVNVSNFVSTKLEFGEVSNNYITWREQMLCLVESQDLLGFINGELVAPEEQGKTKTQDYAVWRRNDRLLKGWILGALTDEVVRACLRFDTARDVWLGLERRFTLPPRPPPSPPPPSPDQEQENYVDSEIYKAALRGEWDTLKLKIQEDVEAGEGRVSFNLEKTLKVAVASEKALDFVGKLVERMSYDNLLVGNTLGHNALHIAALTGNMDAAKILVGRAPALVYGQARPGWFPIHAAATSAHRDIVEFLISHTANNSPYQGSSGVLLLCLVIDADFYDIALDLVEKYPDLARMKHDESDNSAMERLTRRDLAFSRFNFWERFICFFEDYNPLKRRLSEAARSFDNAPTYYGLVIVVIRTLVLFLVFLPCYLVCIVVMLFTTLVPHARRIRAKKLMHQQATRLVKCLCHSMAPLRDKEAASIYNDAMMTAARLGNHEVIQKIIGTFPNAVHARKDGHYFFQVAAQHRNEKVFNLIYQTRDHKHKYSDIIDSRGNTILHLVARLAPQHKLNLVSGAALQMQRELQWFKEVENFVHPYAREQENDDGKTAKMVFTDEHKRLKEEGEKWMKDTSNAYIIVAALNATVVFAAAITVPGGNNSSGYPMFTKSRAFIVFAISDAASLFTSVTSLLMFLSIMTSRYAENDFLYALPKRLCIGLFTLFVSILFMMVAFSASTYMVFGQEHKWVLIPVAALACLPIATFVLLQFPLLWDVISSTYGPSIFGKQTHHTPFFQLLWVAKES